MASKMGISRGNSSPILLLILIFTLTLLPKIDGQSPTTEIENKELTNKLRVTMKVWLNEFEDPPSFQDAVATCWRLSEHLENMTDGDYAMQINWYVRSLNESIVFYAKTIEKITGVFKAIEGGILNGSTADDIKKAVATETKQETYEYVGRPDISLYWLGFNETSLKVQRLNWTTFAKAQGENTATKKYADMVLVTWAHSEGFQVRAATYTRHDDIPFDEMETFTDYYPKVAQRILKKVATKIELLLKSCQCKMVSDDLCYYVPHMYGCRVNVTCAKIWNCQERIANKSGQEKYCSTKITTPCQNHALCKEQCDRAPVEVVQPCNATCDKPHGMERVDIRGNPLYKCCVFEEKKQWKNCSVDKETCKSTTEEKTKAGDSTLVIVLVVVAVLFTAGIVCVIVIVLIRRRRFAAVITDTPGLKLGTKAAEGVVAPQPGKEMGLGQYVLLDKVEPSNLGPGQSIKGAGPAELGSGKSMKSIK